MRTLLTVILAFAIVKTGISQTLPAGSATSGSIFDLESNWRNQEGEELTLSDLKGKVRVVAMGYTSCQYACPRIIADLVRIERELVGPDLDPDKVTLSFISIDPENDTPERMKKLEKEYKFDPRRWLLLTGEEDGVLELAVALGMKYRKTSAMDFAHSNIITILDLDGRILYQTSEIGADISKAMKAIRDGLPATRSD